MTAKVADLDALTNPERSAGVSVGGVVYPVGGLRHADAHRIAVAVEGESPSEVTAAMMDAARHAVPAMPPEVFETLTIQQVSAIVGIARDGADAVEAMLAERAKAAAGK